MNEVVALEHVDNGGDHFSHAHLLLDKVEALAAAFGVVERGGEKRRLCHEDALVGLARAPPLAHELGVYVGTCVQEDDDVRVGQLELVALRYGDDALVVATRRVDEALGVRPTQDVEHELAEEAVHDGG